VAHGKRSPGVDDITLTMSRELLSEDIHLQRDVVSSPAFNPQPPGKINFLKYQLNNYKCQAPLLHRKLKQVQNSPSFSLQNKFRHNWSNRTISDKFFGKF